MSTSDSCPELNQWIPESVMSSRWTLTVTSGRIWRATSSSIAQGRPLDHLPLARHRLGGERSLGIGEEIIRSQGHRFSAGPPQWPFFADRDGFAQGTRWRSETTSPTRTYSASRWGSRTAPTPGIRGPWSGPGLSEWQPSMCSTRRAVPRTTCSGPRRNSFRPSGQAQ